MLFRVVSIGLGLLAIVVLEGVLRIFGPGGGGVAEDPFVGFSAMRPLFELNEAGDEFETALSRTNYFVRDRFPRRRSESTFRGFVLGGSTVQGRPYAIETAFPKWLELSLAARDSSRKWEMVNCGGISYASYRLVPILEECLARYQPDAIVLCTGQNEFLEDIVYQEFNQPPSWVRGLQGRFSTWNLYRLMAAGGRWVQTGLSPRSTSELNEVRPILPEEVDAFLDYRNGLEAYRWDPVWREGVARHFEHNIIRMVEMCRAAGVPIVLLAPPVNLRSTPPFKSEHQKGLSHEALSEWQRLVGLARSQYGKAPRVAIDLLKQAIAIDPQYADTHFALGAMLEGNGRRREARAAFIRAKELDVCPIRMLETERRTLSRVAARFEVPYVDLHALLEEASDFLSLGSDMLVDHVHPTIVGHQLIAEQLAQIFLESGWASELNPDSAERQRVAFETQMESLGPAYFVHGKQRLDNLTLWTQGRTEGLPLELKPSPPNP